MLHYLQIHVKQKLDSARWPPLSGRLFNIPLILHTLASFFFRSTLPILDIQISVSDGITAPFGITVMPSRTQ